MSTQVFTLEQVCQESAGPQTMLESGNQQNNSTIIPSIDVPTKLSSVSAQLTSVLTLSPSLDAMLPSLAAITMQAMGVDLCVFLLQDSEQNCLTIHTCVPDLRDKRLVVQPVSTDDVLWKHLCESMVRGDLSARIAQELELLNPLKNVQYETLISVPLSVGTECVGLLNCYSHKTLEYTRDDLLLLSTMASHMALAIKLRRSIEMGVSVQKNPVHSFLDALFSERSLSPVFEDVLHRRARVLGCDLTKPHTIVVMELSPVVASQSMPVPEAEPLTMYKDIIQHVKQCVNARYPGSLVDERGNLLVWLLCLDNDPVVEHADTWFSMLARQIRYEQHVSLSTGIGNLYTAVGDYRVAYAEATEALEIGQSLKHEEGCTSFDALGVYRYIYAFARTDTLHDQYQRQITAIADYDLRRNANLLDTLETYLECGGSIAKTASQLDVHRNTLLQRLSRLQSICNIDLDQHSHWSSLLTALKVHRLRTHNE